MQNNMSLEELVSEMWKRFPNEIPNKAISSEELNFRRGQQSIIKYIYGQIEFQDYLRKKTQRKDK